MTLGRHEAHEAHEACQGKRDGTPPVPPGVPHLMAAIQHTLVARQALLAAPSHRRDMEHLAALTQQMAACLARVEALVLPALRPLRPEASEEPELFETLETV